MFSDLLITLREFLTSKKFLATVAGVIVAFAAKYGLNLPPDMVSYIVGLIVAYILGQGLADFGKNAAKVHVVGAQAGDQANAAARKAVTKMAEETK